MRWGHRSWSGRDIGEMGLLWRLNVVMDWFRRLGEQFLELGKEKEPDQVHSYVRPVVDTGQAHLNVGLVVGCNMGLSRHNPISYWLRRPIGCSLLLGKNIMYHTAITITTQGSEDHPSTNSVIIDKFTLVPETASALWEVMTYNSTRSGPSPTTNKFAVQNTVLLPILAEKMHQEKVQQEKLKAVKARLNFEETSQYSESGAPSRRRDVRKRLGPKDARSMSRSPEPRRDRSRSPRRKDPKRETVFRRLEKSVFHRLGDKEKGMSAYTGSSRRQSHHNSRGYTESYYQSFRSRGTQPAPKRHHDRKAYSRKGGRMSKSEDSAGEHWKSKLAYESLDDTYMQIRSFIVCKETFPDVRSAYVTISIEESHRVSSGSITGSSQRNQAFKYHTRDDVKKPMTTSERSRFKRNLEASAERRYLYQFVEVSKLISYIIGSDQEAIIYCTISGTPGGTRRILFRRVFPFTLPISDTFIHPESWRIRELRLQGVATWLNYLSEDVDEKRDMEAPPEIRLESFGTTREPITGNITQLLASHPRETERMRRALSPRGAM
ncbi:hypothetical protein Tco_0205751 [Tanacetum coccineum]